MIKEFEISNLDRVMEIWLETNIKTHSFISKDYWINNYESVKKALPQSEVFVFEEDNEIKGFIGILNKYYIAGLFISQEYQSAGIGSKLVNRCKQCYPMLNLDVYAKNLKAIDFYKKHGFVIKRQKQNENTKEMEYSMVWTL